MDKKPDAESEVRQVLQTLRIIVFALVMGVATFTGYAVWTTLQGGEPDEPRDPSMLPMYMAGFAGMALLARLFVPGLIFHGIRRQIASGTWQPGTNSSMPLPKTDEGQLMAALQTKTIVGAALLEGAGFANGFAYLSEQQVLSLVITLVLIAGIATHFPLRLWLDGWLQDQKRRVDEDRSMGRFPE